LPGNATSFKNMRVTVGGGKKSIVWAYTTHFFNKENHIMAAGPRQYAVAAKTIAHGKQ